MPRLLIGSQKRVVLAWLNDTWYVTSSNSRDRNLMTDGRKLWFRGVVIGWTRSDGKKLIFLYTAEYGHFKSMRISKFVNSLISTADRYAPESTELFIPNGPINAHGLPSLRKPLKQKEPIIGSFLGIRMIKHERRGDKIGW